MHIIPRKTRVKMEFFKNVNLVDIILGFIFIASIIALFVANFDYHIWVALAWASLCISMFFPVADDVKLYYTLGYLFRFTAQTKKFSKKEKKNYQPISAIIPFEKIVDNRFIDFKEYFAQVIEITPMSFGLLNEYKQTLMVESFANALRRLAGSQTASIIKINKPLVLDSYVYTEDKKHDSLLELQYEGEVTPEEVEARSGVFVGRVSKMEAINRREKIYKDFFYLVVFDKDKEQLENTIDGICLTLSTAATPLETKKLTGRELAIFLKANYGKEFDERELETIPMSDYASWAMPNEVRFKAAAAIIEGRNYRQFCITDYPLQVSNAWGYPFFSLDRTRIVMKINPISKMDAEKRIDRSIIEMETKFGHSAKTSKQIENQTHLTTLRELLMGLKNNNQQLFEVNTYITCEESARKEVRAILKQEGFKFSEMFGRQVDAFISANLSKRDTIKENLRGIPTTSLAAVFPFISSALQDENGFYIGYNEYPVFVDFFKRNNERVNSNMMVIGKSGSGKSYAIKTLLANFAADNTRIFILDPENEYDTLAENLHGKVIDVGSSQKGIINPFHVMTSLRDDKQKVSTSIEEDIFGSGDEDDVGEDELNSDSFAQHLQFLEQFFRVILEGIASDPFEILNTAVVEVYARKGITENSLFKNLKPADYPIFDDLYDYIVEQIAVEKNEYKKTNLMVVEAYIKKFAKGGRNSKLWNGPTTLETKENFVTFNFQSLLASNNQIIANAQMLIIFKYLMNEIIKNKEFNLKYKVTRKIVVAVDEAHLFINPKYPIALDFMAQMAKRIRKYAGMQIVITQNIKDFIGSPEIQRQSTAVINASQYSMILSLSPSDMNDIVELYRKSGEINESEQNSIVTAERGTAFLITGPMNRTIIHIEAYDFVRKLFGE